MCTVTCSYTTDEVATIREDSIAVMTQLYQLYGIDFAEDTLFPTVEDLIHHEKYLLRVSGVHILTVGVEMGSEG